MSFYTAINCIDGRVQQPVLDYLRERFGVRHIDMITEPGPSGILHRRDDPAIVDSIVRRIDISIGRHGSQGIAVIGHHDCTGNPGGQEKQVRDVRGAIAYLQERYPEQSILGLYVDENWTASEVAVIDGGVGMLTSGRTATVVDPPSCGSN